MFPHNFQLSGPRSSYFPLCFCVRPEPSCVYVTVTYCENLMLGRRVFMSMNELLCLLVNFFLLLDIKRLMTLISQLSQELEILIRSSMLFSFQMFSSRYQNLKIVKEFESCLIEETKFAVLQLIFSIHIYFG